MPSSWHRRVEDPTSTLGAKQLNVTTDLKMKLRPSLCPLAGVPGSPQNLAAERNTWENDYFQELYCTRKQRGPPNLANNGPRNICGRTGFVSEVLALQEWKEISSAQKCPRDWNSNCHVFLTSLRYRIGKQPGSRITSTSFNVRNHLCGLLYSPHNIRPRREFQSLKIPRQHWCDGFFFSISVAIDVLVSGWVVI